jgi:hypothetical protein
MYKKVIALCLLFGAQSWGLSDVYNLKLRRALSLGGTFAKTQQQRIRTLLSAVPLVYIRTRHIVDENQKADVSGKDVLVGSLFNLRVTMPSHWWVELTTGLENQTAHYTGTTSLQASRTALDDIVVTAGKNLFFGKDQNAQIVLYGLAGFPTQWTLKTEELFDPLVGIRFYAVGAGTELSYSFLKTQKRTLTAFLQLRAVHFFSRSWEPILPGGGMLQPGNMSDIYAIAQYHLQRHVVELGYNITFFTNQAVKVAGVTTTQENFRRQTVSGNYLYLFPQLPVVKMPGSLGFGFNVGRATIADTKLAAGWLSASVLF